MKTFTCQVTVMTEITVEARDEFTARAAAERQAYAGDFDGIFSVEVDVLEEDGADEDVDEP